MRGRYSGSKPNKPERYRVLWSFCKNGPKLSHYLPVKVRTVLSFLTAFIAEMQLGIRIVVVVANATFVICLSVVRLTFKRDKNQKLLFCNLKKKKKES